MSSGSIESSCVANENTRCAAQSAGETTRLTLGWFTGLVVPSLALIFSHSMFESRPQPSCAAFFFSAVHACLRDLSENPQSHINSDEMGEVQLTDIQYQLVKMGLSLDRVGLSASQRGSLRKACLGQGYRQVKHFPGFAECR